MNMVLNFSVHFACTTIRFASEHIETFIMIQILRPPITLSQNYINWEYELSAQSCNFRSLVPRFDTLSWRTQPIVKNYPIFKLSILTTNVKRPCFKGWIITLFICMVVIYSIFRLWHGPPLSYLHGKKTLKK